MVRLLTFVAILGIAPSLTLAEDAVEAIGELHDACRDAREPGPRKLYSVTVPAFRFEGYDSVDGVLRIDTRRNLRVLRGSAEIFPSGLENIGFRATRERAEELRGRGRKLRLGFFLGFDGVGRPCVIRSAVAVTTVRADIAFVELLDARGRVVAREDTERFRAWQDDAERYGLPGEGPRAAIVDAMVNGTAAPSTWTEALGSEAVRGRLGRCWRDVLARRDVRDARVIVRGNVDAEGRMSAEVELSSLGDEAASTCVLTALRAVRLPGPARFRFPIRFER